MDISWRAFSALWAFTIVVGFLSDGRTGMLMIGIAIAATVMRLGGYEQGWRKFTVMPFLGSIFLLLAAIFRP